MSKAEVLKMKVISTVTGNMVKKNITPGELAKEIKVAKHRVEALLNPADMNIDLMVLCKVCSYLRINLTVRNRGDKMLEQRSSDPAPKPSQLPRKEIRPARQNRVLGSAPVISSATLLRKPAVQHRTHH